MGPVDITCAVRLRTEGLCSTQLSPAQAPRSSVLPGIFRRHIFFARRENTPAGRQQPPHDAHPLRNAHERADVPFLQLTIDLGSRDPEPLRRRPVRAGAVSVTLRTRPTTRCSSPRRAQTPLWPTVVVKALFGADADAAATGERRSSRRCPAGAARPLRDARRQGLGTRVAQGLPADALRTPPLGVPGRHAGRPPTRTRSASNSTPASPSAPARTRPRHCASSGWTRTDSRRGRVIDYGCGSGILAIAALKLGAARVPCRWTSTRRR